MTAYLTLAEANIYNTGDPTWDAASDVQKQEAIDYGRQYMDLYYSYSINFEEDAAPDTIKEANAKLGIKHLTTPLFNQSVTVNRVKTKSFGGGGVTHSRTYGSVKKTITDPLPDITLFLVNTARLKASKAFGAAGILRT